MGNSKQQGHSPRGAKQNLSAKRYHLFYNTANTLKVSKIP